MIKKESRKLPKGQSMVEFALVLPFLLILFLGMIEVGYAMYDYLVLSNANREGVRLAARGRFDDSTIKTRIVGAGGYRNNDVNEPNLNIGENFGMLITHISLPDEVPDNWATQMDIQICCQPDCDIPESDVYMTRCISPESVIADENEVRALQESDSLINELVLEFDGNAKITNLINDIREDNEFDRQRNELVIVETYLAHSLLLKLPDFVPLDDPIGLYFRSAMRVTLNSRTGGAE